MSTIATLVVKITADASGFNKIAQGVNRKASQIGQSATQAGTRLTNGFTKPVVAGLAIAGGAMAALSVKSFLAVAAVDELVVVNEVLARNANLSEAAVKAEAAEVKSMGIEAAAAQRIVAEFIKAELDLAKASDIARVAQDAAVISQSNSSDAAADITLGITKLNPLILRNQGIIVDSQVAYDNYAAANGLVAAELTKTQQQQAFMNAVMEQGEKIAGAYAAAMNEPGKVLRSFPRFFNDIFIAIGGGLKDAFGDSIFALADFVKGLGKALEKGGALHPVIEKIGAVLGPVSENFVSFIQNIDFDVVASKAIQFIDTLVGLGATISKVIAWFANLSPEVKKFIPVVLGLLVVIGPLLLIFGAIVSAVTTLISIFGVIGTVIAFIFSPVGLLIAALIGLGIVIAVFGEDAMNTFRMIGGIIDGVLQLIGRAIINFFVNLIATWTTNWNNLVTIVKNIFNIDWGQIGLSIIQGIANGIMSGIGFLATAVGNAAMVVVDGFKGLFGIESPSKVMAKQVGMPIGEGVGVGIDQALAKISPNMDAIMGSITPISARQPAGVPQVGAGGGGNFEIVINNPVAETASESIPNAMRKLAFLGKTT